MGRTPGARWGDHSARPGGGAHPAQPRAGTLPPPRRGCGLGPGSRPPCVPCARPGPASHGGRRVGPSSCARARSESQGATTGRLAAPNAPALRGPSRLCQISRATPSHRSSRLSSLPTGQGNLPHECHPEGPRGLLESPGAPSGFCSRPQALPREHLRSTRARASPPPPRMGRGLQLAPGQLPLASRPAQQVTDMQRAPGEDRVAK